MPQEFKPLMDAISGVLDALGNREALAQPLRDKADALHALHVEYEECCCFFAHVIPYASPRRPAPAPKPPKGKKTKKARGAAKASKGAKKAKARKAKRSR